MWRIILFLIFTANMLYSAGTKYWITEGFNNFNQGKMKNLILNEFGWLFLSPNIEKIKSIQDMFLSLYIWDIKEDSKGNIYIATGDEGKVYKLTPDGNLKEFFDTPSIGAFRIAINKKDEIFISTLTRGLIYKLHPDGKGDIFYVFDGEYIWDMEFNKNKLILATGTPGILYELDLKTKKLKELTLTPQMHILCMDFDKKGNIYFGTSDKGVVYRLKKGENKPEVLFQPQENEVHTIKVDKKTGIVYAATADSFEYVYPVKKDQYTQGKTQKQQRETRKRKNTVYKIIPDKYVVPILTTSKDIFLTLEFDNWGGLLIGSGDRGIIYRYNNERLEKFAQLEEREILTIRNTGRRVIIGTGDPGNLYVVKKGYAKKGSYISKIYDTGGISSWGNLFWDVKEPPKTKVTLQLRCGNTEDFSSEWSEWTEEFSMPGSSKINLPPARYIQFKANFYSTNKKFTPVLYKVKIPYLIHNRPPVIKYFALKKDKQTKRKKKTEKKNRLRKFIWEAEDPDGDELIYSIYAKRTTSNKWLLIAKNITTENEFEMDTKFLPDGVYQFKLVADDIKSNAKGANKRTESISPRYIIDNTPPRVVIKKKSEKKKKCVIKGEVVDELSWIKQISYTIDRIHWINILPDDMVFDSRKEKFTVKFELYDSEIDTILLKAIDESDNQTTILLEIK